MAAPRWSVLAIGRPADGDGDGSQAARSTTPAGSGVIIGRVVESGSSTPVVGAEVTISGAALGTAASVFNGAAGAAGPRRIETDTSGRFLARELPKGSYQISVVADGYLNSQYGRTRPPLAIQRVLDVGRSVDLGDGETKADVTILMWKAGAISGTVADENGDPMVGLGVWMSAVSDTWGGRLT
jgi:hypothetical protein